MWHFVAGVFVGALVLWAILIVWNYFQPAKQGQLIRGDRDSEYRFAAELEHELGMNKLLCIEATNSSLSFLFEQVSQYGRIRLSCRPHMQGGLAYDQSFLAREALQDQSHPEFMTPAERSVKEGINVTEEKA